MVGTSKALFLADVYRLKLHDKSSNSMTKLRAANINSIHNFFCEETIKWKGSQEKDSFQRYLVIEGGFHLLQQDRKDDTIQRLCDESFLLSFFDASKTIIRPLSALRIVGLSTIKRAYMAKAAGWLSEGIQMCITKDRLHLVASVFDELGVYDVGLAWANCALRRSTPLF